MSELACIERPASGRVRVPTVGRVAPWLEPEPRFAILVDTDKPVSSMIVRVLTDSLGARAAYLERDQFDVFGWFEAFGKIAPLESFGAYVEAEQYRGGVRFRAVVSHPRPVTTTGGRAVTFESGCEWAALHERFHREIWE